MQVISVEKMYTRSVYSVSQNSKCMVLKIATEK